MLTAMIQEDYGLGVSESPLPGLPMGGAVVRVLGCGVCGSDLDKLINRKSKPGQVLGHEVVGVIEVLDAGHPKGWQVGDRLVTAHHVPCLQCHYCLNDGESMCRQFKQTNLAPGGFAERIALTTGHLEHTAFRVPVHVSSEDASCVEPLACVIRAVNRSETGGSRNKTVVIVGLGFIGLLAAQLYMRKGYKVLGLDLDRARLALAESHGFVTRALHPMEDVDALQAALGQASPVGAADIAFLTAVSPKTLEQGLALLRDGGNLVVFTSGTPGTLVDPSQLYFREINLITSYSPSLANLKEAAELIFSGEIHVSPLVTHNIPLPEIERAFELYRSGHAVKAFISMEAP